MALVFLLFVILLLYPILRHPWTCVAAIPSRKAHRKWIQTYLRNIPDTVVIEPGSGWGGMISSLSSKHEGTGLELSPLVWLYSKLTNKRRNVRYLLRDALNYDYTRSEVVVVFMTKEFMDKLIPKLKPHTLVISSYFKAETGAILIDTPLPNLYVYKIAGIRPV